MNNVNPLGQLRQELEGLTRSLGRKRESTNEEEMPVGSGIGLRLRNEKKSCEKACSSFGRKKQSKRTVDSARGARSADSCKPFIGSIHTVTVPRWCDGYTEDFLNGEEKPGLGNGARQRERLGRG